MRRGGVGPGRRGGGPHRRWNVGGFLPGMLNPDIWHHSEKGAELTSGEVSKWVDLSGHGQNHHDNSDPILRPIYEKTTGFNSRYTVRFDGDKNVTSGTALQATAAYTRDTDAEIFVVMKTEHSVAPAALESGFWSFTGGTALYPHDVGPGTWILPAFYSSNTDSDARPPTADITQPHILNCRTVFSTADSYLYINGALEASQLGGTYSNPSTLVADSLIGRTKLTSRWHSGWWAEFVLFYRIIADWERSLLLNYFANEWGV